jgi:restriction system protein
VNVEYLSQFDEFAAFKSRSRDNASKSDTKASAILSAPTSTQTPEETIDASYQELNSALAADLLERLKENSPVFFEQAVLDLLVKMGYGGSRQDAARRVGQSGDGGIDGVINEDRLGLDAVYIQAKRWQGSVGAGHLRDFTGSLEANRSTKGVFITTSDFTEDAREHVRYIPKRIILINGQELAQLMIDFNIGVTARTTYVLKKIDEDYFSEE